MEKMEILVKRRPAQDKILINDKCKRNARPELKKLD